MIASLLIFPRKKMISRLKYFESLVIIYYTRVLLCYFVLNIPSSIPFFLQKNIFYEIK